MKQPALSLALPIGTRYVGRLFHPTAILILLAALWVPATAGPGRDVLYQTATIDALMAGLFDGQMSIGQLTKRGDFGLGTFDKLDGEMVVLDGIVYQITSDGVAHKASASVTTPFAAVTFFDNDRAARIRRERALPALKEYLDSMLPSKNLFYAIRIDGTFTRVRTRSVPRQSKPYPRLSDVVARQPVFEFADVKGTVVALRCPYYVKGVNVPGYHMHFITADRKRGGHLLDCTLKSGIATLDVTPEFHLLLPRDETFYRTDFESDNGEELEKVEQGK